MEGRTNPSKEHSGLERKTAQLLAEVSKDKIDLREVRKLVSQGIPGKCGLRPTAWKLLLNYLPKDRKDWDSDLAKHRKQYADFCKELIVNPTDLENKKDNDRLASNSHAESSLTTGHTTTGIEGQFDSLSIGSTNLPPTCNTTSHAIELEADEEAEEGELKVRSMSSDDDHPLCLAPTSVWNQYFKDSEVAAQISRDVLRTHPDNPFFSAEGGTGPEVQESMKRVLFLFAKLNQGLRYVQGMNEVLAPIFFVFATDPDPEMASHAEADSFFCFSRLLGDFRDNFCQQLDNSAVGIKANIARLSLMLRRYDEELWDNLENTTKINPQFYAFRWITLLLTQEFGLDDVLRLWDYLLGNLQNPTDTLLRMCCGMLVSIRQKLLAGDFTTNLKILQNYPRIDLEAILQVAEDVVL